MSVEIELSARAQGLADAMRQRRSGLGEKKAKLEEQLREVNAELALDFNIDDRLADFEMTIRRRFPMPILLDVRWGSTGVVGDRPDL